MSENPSRFGAFLAELRRRHVWRVAIAYGAAAFVLLQAGEIVLPAFEVPDWVLRLVVVLLLVGFPVAIALAWVYELTPHGIRRTQDLESVLRGPGRPGRLLPRVAFLGLTLVTAGTLGWWTINWTVPHEAGEADLSSTVAPVSFEPATATAIRALAVLPFESFAEDTQADYFTAGMHEAVVSQLSQIGALRVVSRTSVMRFQGTTLSIPEIARELGVQGVVEGSVLRAGNRVRITVQLIHGLTDRHLWSNSYERYFTDVIALQSEVARAIAGEIQAELTPDEQTRLASAGPVDPEAHESYLRGRYEQSKGTSEALAEAVRHYEEAIDRDSTFAAAYAALAGSQLLLDMTETQEKQATEATPRLPSALEAAEQALILDAGSPEARAVLAEIQRRVAETSDSLRRELHVVRVGLDSSALPNRDWIAAFTDFGRQVERLALSVEPEKVEIVAPVWRVAGARRLAAFGQAEEAVQRLRQMLERDPSRPEAWDALEYVYALQGDDAEIVSLRRERLARAGDGAEARGALEELESAVAERGMRGYWEWRLDELERSSAGGTEVSQVDVAAALVALGRNDEALNRLERADELRDPKLFSLQFDPTWDPIRADPRFVSMLRRVRRMPPPPPKRR